MEKSIRIRSFFYLLSVFVWVLCTACATLLVEGSNPVQRADSAAQLLLDGSTGDTYIKAYKTETEKAEQYIADMLKKAEADESLYADIADNVDEWLSFYEKVGALSKRYPDGLTGKSETVFFKTADYRALKEKAAQKACTALFREAERLHQASSGNLEKLPRILSVLKRARNYSYKEDERLCPFGAQLCFAAAEADSQSNNPKILVSAADYYMQADSWLSGYKNAVKKADLLKQRAVQLYVQDANAKMNLKNYPAFRQAKQLYLQARHIAPDAVSAELSDVNKKLTVRLYIVYGGMNSKYPDEAGIKKAVQETVQNTLMGPDTVDVYFMHENESGRLFFAEKDGADLVFAPSDSFGTVWEVNGPINLSSSSVSKTVDGVTYTGTINESSQKVTVFFQNDFVLYDVRSGTKKELNVFRQEGHKTSKVFTSRSYKGDERARPSDFDAGALYVPGQYALFFPGFKAKNEDYAALTQSFGTLNETGKQLCWIISNLQYTEN